MHIFMTNMKLSIRLFYFLLLFFLFNGAVLTGCTNSREGVKEEYIRYGEETSILTAKSKEEIRQEKRTLFDEIEGEKAKIDTRIKLLEDDIRGTLPISEDSLETIRDRMKYEKKRLNRQANRIESANFESWGSTKNDIINTIEEVKGNMELLVVKAQ